MHSATLDLFRLDRGLTTLRFTALPGGMVGIVVLPDTKQAAIGDMEQDFVAYRAEREAQGKARPVQIRKAG